MRRTITLDADVEALVRRAMQERGLTFKQAVNEAIRTGLGRDRGTRRRYRTPTFHMGFNASLHWDKALNLAAELEDEELIRKMELGK